MQVKTSYVMEANQGGMIMSTLLAKGIHFESSSRWSGALQAGLLNMLVRKEEEAIISFDKCSRVFGVSIELTEKFKGKDRRLIWKIPGAPWVQILAREGKFETSTEEALQEVIQLADLTKVMIDFEKIIKLPAIKIVLEDVEFTELRDDTVELLREDESATATLATSTFVIGTKPVRWSLLGYDHFKNFKREYQSNRSTGATLLHPTALMEDHVRRSVSVTWENPQYKDIIGQTSWEEARALEPDEFLKKMEKLLKSSEHVTEAVTDTICRSNGDYNRWAVAIGKSWTEHSYKSNEAKCAELLEGIQKNCANVAAQVRTEMARMGKDKMPAAELVLDKAKSLLALAQGLEKKRSYDVFSSSVNNNKISCKFWTNGECKEGNNCKFSHAAKRSRYDTNSSSNSSNRFNNNYNNNSSYKNGYNSANNNNSSYNNSYNTANNNSKNGTNNSHSSYANKNNNKVGFTTSINNNSNTTTSAAKK